MVVLYLSVYYLGWGGVFREKEGSVAGESAINDFRSRSREDFAGEVVAEFRDSYSLYPRTQDMNRRGGMINDANATPGFTPP